MDASRLSSSYYRFGHCEIDAATRTLSRRGRPVGLEPRGFDLLLHLIGHHHRVVSADELIDAVWGGAAVTASSVSQAFRMRTRSASHVLDIDPPSGAARTTRASSPS